jgi:hypothetical protein
MMIGDGSTWQLVIIPDCTGSTEVCQYNETTETWAMVDFGAHLTARTGNLTYGSGGTFTHTYDAGASDPVWTFTSGVVNLTTGALQVGGNGVLDSTDNLASMATSSEAQLEAAISGVTNVFTNNDTIDVANLDANLYTREAFHVIFEDIAITDELVITLPPWAGTMTRIDCEAQGGTSFTINVCDGEDAGDDTCTTSIPGSTIVCTTSPTNDTTLSATGFAARDKVTIVVTAVSGAVNSAEIILTATID